MIYTIKIHNNKNISLDILIWNDIFNRFFTDVRIPLKNRKRILDNCMFYEAPFYTVKGDILTYEISDWALQKISNEYDHKI
jgi:hypothetical protein